MLSPFSRRSFLQATGATALGLALAGTTSRTAFAVDTTDSFAPLRSTWATLTSGGSIDAGNPAYATALSNLNTQAATALSALDTSSGRTQLFTDLPLGSSHSSANVTGSLNRLETLALAYVTPGTAHTGDPSVLEDVIGGLDFMTGAGPYSAASGLPQYGWGNWWDWEIGSPQALQDTANLVYSSLTSAQIATYCAAIDHFVPDPTVMVQASGTTTSTGANRLDMCRVVIIRGALGGDSSKISQGVSGISPTLPFVTSGDGLYADGSFVQHTNNGAGLAYTGTYGGVWLGDLARLMTLLAGSPWALTDPGTGNVFFAATSAFTPVVYNGLMLDAVRGRAVARSGEPDGSDGLSAARNLIMLSAATSDSGLAARLKSTAKGWLRRSPYPVTANGGIPTISLAEQVLNDPSVTAAPEPVRHSLFPNMDRAVHRRPGWAAAISMASSRIAYYENDGGSNIHGWHTGDGMTYLYLDSDNTQYDDVFWPTVDPYRLPGTTVSTLQLAAGQGGAYGAPRPAAAWVGGASDGEFAAIGQDLRGPFSTLVAKKSWFCLDDAVVCLGAGIGCGDGTDVETVIDNRNLGAGGTNALAVDALTQPTAQGWTSAFAGARWAHLDGQAGYVFPGSATLNALREERTAAWSDIDAGDSTTRYTRRYVTLWLDHGANPTDGSYAYIVMPGASRAATLARAADSAWMRTLANSAARQAIAVPRLGVIAANFYAAGTAGPLTTDAPACVLVREHGDGTATVCVSDPARQNTGLHVTWRRPVSTVLSSPSSVTRAGCGSSLRLTFGDMTALSGATQTITVRLA